MKECKNCGAKLEICYEPIPVIMVAGEIGILCPVCRYIHRIEFTVKEKEKQDEKRLQHSKG